MDHLQSDIDSLESEKSSLRDKLKSYSSKKGDLKTTTALGKHFYIFLFIQRLFAL